MRTKTSCLGTVTLTLFLVLCSCASRTAAQTNNTVNGTSGSIRWGELAPDESYKTTDYEADDGGLDPYYDLAVSFIGSSLPEELPVDTVKDILEGNASIGDKWQDLAKDFVGYALCVVIGFLFILIFPIVACCFCCCRCCGNCGGKRLQKEGPNDGCKRIAFSIVLAVLSLFVIAGAACTFVTSDQIHKNLDGLNSSFSDSVDDFNTFVDNINNQFTRLGDTNFQFLSKVLEEYVQDASPEVSERIINSINKLVNLDTKLNELDTLTGEAMVLADTLSNQLTTLETQKRSTKSELQTINVKAPCSGCLNNEITALDGVDLTPMENQITDFKTKVATDVFKKMKDDLDSAIKTEVDAATTGINVKQKLDDIFNDQIKPMLDQVDTLKQNLNDDASKYQEKVDDYVDLVTPYDQYRWYAGLALACFLLLIALLMLIGVLLGCLCGSVKDKPTERGAASNCGGILLMSAVGLIFIFGALLMLLTTLMYIFGAPFERYVCQSVDHLERIEKYTSTFDLGFDLQNISFNVNGETVTTSVSKVMDGCEQGKTLYDVLKLDSVVDTALDQISDYKNDLSKIGKIDAGSAASAADGSVDVSTEIQALQDTVTSIDAVETNINALKINLQNQKNAVDTKVPGTGAGAKFDPMLNTLDSMAATTTQLKAKAQDISTAATNLNSNELPDAFDTLKNSTVMTQLVNETTQQFVSTIFGFVDSYVNDIRTKLAEDIAVCTPFYSITNAILGEAFCHGIIDPLNGFWLALGWCIFFFMPSLIIAVKLAKHFRTMLYEDGYDPTVEPSAPPYYTEASAQPTKQPSIFPPINGPKMVGEPNADDQSRKRLVAGKTTAANQSRMRPSDDKPKPPEQSRKSVDRKHQEYDQSRSRSTDSQIAVYNNSGKRHAEGSPVDKSVSASGSKEYDQSSSGALYYDRKEKGEETTFEEADTDEDSEDTIPNNKVAPF